MTVDQETGGVVDLAIQWVGGLERALAGRDSSLLRELFLEDSYWRDMVVFEWDVHQAHGIDAVEEGLFRHVDMVKPSNFALDDERPAPTVDESTGEPIVEVFFTFETAVAYAKGFLNAIPDESSPWGMRARLLNTVVCGLKGVADEPSAERHPGLGYEKARPGQTWGDYARERAEYVDRDPEVLVVGGGQNGIGMASRLKHMGVDVLVVEKNARPGDNWRKRYDNLALHTPTDMSDLPWLRFPKSFPNYLPKDVFANYLESYVAQMDLNYWASTEFLGGDFDDEAGRWTVRVRRGDGSERTMHPTHLILSVGQSAGKPNIPHFEGLDSFAGEVMHSTQFHSGKDYAGKKAMVIGVSTSAHDIAYDLYNNDAEVTMVQRSPTSVVSIDSANLAYGFYWLSDMPQEEADQRFNASYVYPLLIEALKRYTEMTNEVNKELLEGLAKAGMRLDTGEDGTGWLMKFIRYGGGYYLNVGCSDVIIEGGITITQLDDIDRFVPEGVLMKDGTIRELDVIVLATGFQKLITQVAELLGDEIAEKVGTIAGIGEDGEQRNLARPTAQQHLWFIFGGIAEARKTTPWLAYQIKGQLLGLAPSLIRQKDGTLKAVERKAVHAGQ